jgi:acyl dehydratase
MPQLLTLNFENLETHVGDELGVSDWFEITQERINAFADATGDHQWIHVDEARAKAEYGHTIAHGLFILSLLPKLQAEIFEVDGIKQALNYGANKIRFMNMVPVNSRIRLKTVLHSVTEKSGGKLIQLDCTFEIDGASRPACIAETLALMIGE